MFALFCPLLRTEEAQGRLSAQVGIFNLDKVRGALVILNGPLEGTNAFNWNLATNSSQVLADNGLKVNKVRSIWADGGRSHGVNAKGLRGKVHGGVRIERVGAGKAPRVQ